jgi:hypothetical protein
LLPWQALASGCVPVSPKVLSLSIQIVTARPRGFGKVKDYVFRACFIDPFQGTVAAKFALDTLKAKTAFVMFDQANDYAKGLAEYFEKAFTGRGGLGPRTFGLVFCLFAALAGIRIG